LHAPQTSLPISIIRIIFIEIVMLLLICNNVWQSLQLCLRYMTIGKYQYLTIIASEHKTICLCRFQSRRIITKWAMNIAPKFIIVKAHNIFNV
jgi:hypothetical protein